jgi:putative addiction module component (TIGR02574 family)
MKVADIPQIQSLSVGEKLRLVEELWAEIIRQPGHVPIPEWHVSELDHDFAAYQANPREGSPWDEVKDRVLRRT